MIKTLLILLVLLVAAPVSAQDATVVFRGDAAANELSPIAADASNAIAPLEAPPCQPPNCVALPSAQGLADPTEFSSFRIDVQGALVCTQESLAALLKEQTGLHGDVSIWVVGEHNRQQRYAIDPSNGLRFSHVERDRETLLQWLRTLKPGELGLIGYVGDDGDFHALTEADLRK